MLDILKKQLRKQRTRWTKEISTVRNCGNSTGLGVEESCSAFQEEPTACNEGRGTEDGQD